MELSAARAPWQPLLVHQHCWLLLFVVMPVSPRSPLPAPTACPQLCHDSLVLSLACSSCSSPGTPSTELALQVPHGQGGEASTPLLQGMEQLSAWPGPGGAQGRSCWAQRCVPGHWGHQMPGAAGPLGAGVRAAPRGTVLWGPT